MWAPALLILTGFAASEALVALGYDTGLRWYQFGNVVFYGLIPALVFAASYRVDPREWRRDALLIVLLGVPVALVVGGVCGWAVYQAIAHPQGFPLSSAMLLGAILIASDPRNIAPVLKQSRHGRRLGVILEGEGALNDAIAIVAFSMLAGMGAMAGQDADLDFVAGRLLWVVIGGAGIGGAVGYAVRPLLRRWTHAGFVFPVTVVVAYGVYIVAGSILGASGVIALLVFAVLCGSALVDHENVHRCWRALTVIAASALLLLAGATITLAMFADRWLAMLIAIAASIGVRFAIVYPAVTAAKTWAPAASYLDHNECTVLGIGSPRGVVALALALSLPLSIPGWYTVQAAVYGVVMFSLFVQLPLMHPFIRSG